MTYAELRRQETALANWLAQTDWLVFGTLKFTDGYNISTEKAQALVRKLFNTLDRLYLGQNHVAAGHRLERVVFEQLGTSGENLHYHFVARPSTDAARFCETARCVWDEAGSFTMGYENTVIEIAKSARKASGYCLHEYTKRGADTLYLPASHMHAAQAPNEPLPKLRRLLKRQDANERTKERALTRAATVRATNIAERTAIH